LGRAGPTTYDPLDGLGLKETDVMMRSYLAQRSMKKGDLSKFIEEAVMWRVLDRSMTEAEQVRRHAPVELGRSSTGRRCRQDKTPNVLSACG
jgi:hypothetical protein